ncbi:Glycine--tRNA ligase 2 [Hibiscus syriacus]|uniref:glycine--tRNA ligase n=1 Tax=Hibiscus syriacus TaxID=106335 RepID=A0A6A2YRW7_HIBSY|nr:Glycine--tRNA ligase 2 [Hibiscus syriacus]
MQRVSRIYILPDHSHTREVRALLVLGLSLPYPIASFLALPRMNLRFGDLRFRKPLTYREILQRLLKVFFSRPICWIMSLHGDAVVPFGFARILSENLSYSLRWKENNFGEPTFLTNSVKGNIVFQESLFNEVVNLVEAPVPPLGKFKEPFLELPGDHLTMVMQKHQKYFPITDVNGKLLPYFIAVENGAINEMVVIKGNEAVLRARYEDAKFFSELDTNKKFKDFCSQLKGNLFHEKLGTMLDKMMRVEKMVCKLSVDFGVEEDMLLIVKEAASLAMSDLATAVVTEFTLLSGIMTRHYAFRDGYSDQIIEALLAITLPEFSGDVLPNGDVGIIIAIADRLDSLVGLFADDCQPSSTSGLFGLRRISCSLVQILGEKDKNMDLKHALDLTADVQPIKVDATTIENAYQFVTRRLPVVKAYFRPTKIIHGKEVDADIEVDVDIFETNEDDISPETTPIKPYSINDGKVTPIEVEDRKGKIAALLKQHEAIVKGVAKTAPIQEVPLLGSGIKIEVCCINDGAKTLWKTKYTDKFYSGDCYVVLYSYHSGEGKEDYFMNLWRYFRDYLKALMQLPSRMEHGFNNSYQPSARNTLFEDRYEHPHPTLLRYIPDSIGNYMQNLHAQYRRRITSEEGDWENVSWQPYQHYSLHPQCHHNLGYSCFANVVLLSQIQYFDP